MADKDLDAILPLMPKAARYIFVAPNTPRARRADDILQRFLDYAFGSARNDNATTARNDRRATTAPSVKAGVEQALSEAGKDTIIYIGGSAFVVAEALQGTELE